jgi:Na+(H+)/acetate symporter ActP
VDEIVALAVGVAAALSFPIVVVAVHGRRERRRNRKMGSRRNDKIRLTGDE